MGGSQGIGKLLLFYDMHGTLITPQTCLCYVSNRIRAVSPQGKGEKVLDIRGIRTYMYSRAYLGDISCLKVVAHSLTHQCVNL